MANPNISVDVSGNTAKLQQQINQVARKPIVVDISAGGRGSAQPLGRLSGQITEIDKSLAAANARVIAFGAAAGTIFALENAVTALFKSFVNTEKKLTDINVLLNLTDKNLASFGASLFDIAGNTAQSFDVVAEAATELSRQGLGVEETLKRTEAALILTRLSGLDAASSVSALTATINSFQNSLLSASEVVNKLANVDAAFAVSSADLANALSRVGSSADDAGISFDELIALVTTAQQITARGGAVIGNSLKTIFTRLGRGKVQDVLGGLGISATDEQGQVKNQVQLLKELALVYDTLSSTQKNYVAEQVGGVFQINILKAALGDLGKEYSIYDRALATSLSTTDQAIQRNEQLNQTLSALGSQTLANVQKAASSVGEGLFGEASRNALNITNFLAEGVSNSDTQSVGGQIGKGVIDGLSKFLAGPGLALATGVIIKLLADFAKYGSEAFKSILGTNAAAKEQAVVQQNVAKFLQSNNGLYSSILKGQTSVSSAAKEYLTVIQQQTAALQKQNAVAASISKSLAGSVGVSAIGGKQFVTTKGKGKTAASGYLPQAMEQANINARIGGANPATDKPVTIPNFAFGGGKRGTITAHTGEWAVPNFAGGDGTAIFNKDMKAKYGLPSGARKVFASGFIPNFAKTKLPPNISLEEAIQSNQYSRSQLSQRFTAAVVNSRLGSAKKTSLGKGLSSAIDLGQTSTLSLIYGEKAGIKNETGFFNTDKKGFIADKKTPNGKTYKLGFKSSGYNAVVKPEDAQLEKLLGDQVIDFTNRFISIFGNYSPNAKIKSVQQLANYGSFRSIAGNIFESAVTQATDSAVTQAGRSGGSSAIIDFVNPNSKLRKLFNNIPGDYEAKIGNQQNLINDVARKAFISKKLKIKPGQLSESKASGFIPNFSSTNRGVPVSQIRAHFDKNGSPVAVTNTRDEPNGLKDAIGRERKGLGMYAGGFIPNFAVGNEGEAQEGIADFTKSMGAVVSQIALFASISQLGKKDVNELKDAYKQRADIERKAISQQKENIKKTSTIGPGPLQRGSSNYKAAMLDIEQKAQAQRAARRSSTGMLQQGISSIKGFRPGLGTSFAAPIIAETIANAIPQETKGGRVGAALASGVGQIGSYAGLGGLVGGGPGAIIGGAVGAIAGLTDVIKQLNTSIPELQAKADNSRESLARVNENTQNLLVSYEQYTSMLSSGTASQEDINKAQKSFTEFLNKFDPKQAEIIIAALEKGGATGLRTAAANIQEAATSDAAANDVAIQFQKAFEKLDFNPESTRKFSTFGGEGLPIDLLGINAKYNVVSADAAKIFQEAIIEGAKLSKEPISDRLSRLGGIGNIGQNIEPFIKEFLGPITNPENIKQILSSDDAKKEFEKIIKAALDGLKSGAEKGKEVAKVLGDAAGKDVVAGFSKEVVSGLAGQVDSILSYSPKTSKIQDLKSQFSNGDISREEFVAKKSLERLNIARQLGLTAEQIAVQFGTDIQNVTTVLGNNLIKQAREAGLSGDLLKNVRKLAIPAAQEAIGLPATGNAPKEAEAYLKNKFAPSGEFKAGQETGLLNEIKRLIDRNVISGGQGSDIYKNITTMSSQLESSTSSAAQNLKLAESSSSSIFENLQRAAGLFANPKDENPNRAIENGSGKTDGLSPGVPNSDIQDLRRSFSGAGTQTQPSSVNKNFSSAEGSSSTMRSNMEEMVSLTNVIVEKLGKFVSVRTEPGNFVPEGRVEPALVDNGPPVMNTSFSITPTPVAITFASEGSTVLADLDVKLNAEKQRILDEVGAKLQLIRTQNNLR